VKLDSFIEALAEHKIIETVRSGVSGIARGEKCLHLYVELYSQLEES
jgi:acetolactate synthase-1/3 small subunit